MFNLTSATRWGFNSAILLAIVVALYLGHALFIPLIIALLLSAILWPGANWLHQSGLPLPWLRRTDAGIRPGVARLRFPWGLACLSVVLGLILLILIVILSFGVGLGKIIVDLGSADKQRDVYVKMLPKLERISPVPLDPEYFNPEPDKSEVLKSIRGALSPDSQPFVNMMFKAVEYGGGLLWQSILVIFILLFLLLEGRMLSRRVVEIFGPTPSEQGKAVGALKDIAYQVRAYLIWRTAINFLMAAFLGVLYYVLGLTLPWTWALLTAILWYIPYIGPIIAGFPPILDAFVSCNSPWVAVFILCFYAVFVTIEGYVIVPVVMGRSMEMNATTVLLACLFWELVWGAPGLFLAMPLMAAVKAVCSHVPEWKPWANLMSSHDDADDDPSKPPLVDMAAAETQAVPRG